MENRRKNGVFEAIRMAAVTHRLLTAGTVLCAAASVAASLVPPLLLARIIDGLTAGLPLTFPAVLLYFGSLALEGMLSSAQEGLLVLFGQKMTHALRSEMSRKLTKLPASTLVGQNPGEVAARFSGDVDTVEALFTSGIISMAADACRILSIMAVIAVKNTGLALILLLVLPLFAAFTRHVQTRMLAAQLDNRRAVAAVSGQIPETLHNIRTIRALGPEDYMERRYDRCIGESYAAMERTNFYDAIYSPVVLVLNAAVVGIVMLLSASGNAAVLTLFGMSVGTSVAVINYISRIFAPIESLGMEIQTIQSAMAGVRRIDAFLDQPERTIPKERETSARGDVVLSHVTFGYGEKHVLNDFSMTVKQGEQVTLVGRTGAGKSTVFKLLLGLYHPEAGSVTIGGVDVADITDAERRTCIGCVEQHFARVQGTVLEQITLGDPDINEKMARNAAKLAGLYAAIQTLPNGYDTVCTDGMFSQGEWQLLSIARAAAADPAVLLLDEITAMGHTRAPRILLVTRHAGENLRRAGGVHEQAQLAGAAEKHRLLHGCRKAALAPHHDVLGTEQRMAAGQVKLVDMTEEARAVQVCRVTVDLARRPHLDEPPLVHDGDAVAKRHGLLAVMRHEQHRDAKAALDVAHLATHAQAQVGVEVAERLVKQKDLGPQHERAREGHALALPARDVCHARVRLVLQAHGVKHLAGALLGLGTANAGLAQAVGHVARNREVREQRVGLEHR